MTLVIHQPRVAWDAARAFVRAARGVGYEQFAGAVYQQLGADIYDELSITRSKLAQYDARTAGDQYMSDVEAGKWRVRLEELLRTRPDLVSSVQELTGRAVV